MIRAALAFTAGYFVSSISESRLVRSLRRRYLNFHLGFVQREIEDVIEDIADARLESNRALDAANEALVNGARFEDYETQQLFQRSRSQHLDAETLVIFYVQLRDKRDELRKRINALQ
jgi:hypothetical protein